MLKFLKERGRALEASMSQKCKRSLGDYNTPYTFIVKKY